MIKSQSNRLRELDFLRGIAVLLVLCRHQHLTWMTTNMGWIGVDLFFVLSGFLIAGLLFREYISSSAIDIRRFLIRRGFKIYPLYYLFFCLYICFRLIEGIDIDIVRILPEIFFLQNYVVGAVYVMPISWSLAVEEHFYFNVAGLIWWRTKFRRSIYSPRPGLFSGNKPEHLFLCIMFICLSLRVVSNLIFYEDTGGNTRMTHLRIDSLMAGALIAYWYYFKQEQVRFLFRKHQLVLATICVIGLVWTPFVDMYTSIFAKTIGFTLLYIAFGIILLFFLFLNNINQRLNRLFTPFLVNLVSRIGYCSYAIYLVHLFVIMMLRFLLMKTGYTMATGVQFIVVLGASVSSGVFITFTIERFFLSIRERYFPAKMAIAAVVIKEKEKTNAAGVYELTE